MATTSACARPCCLAPAWNESVHQFRLSLRCTGTGVARDAACREGKLSPVGLLQVHVPDRMSGLAGMLRRRRHVITEYLPQPWISACGSPYLQMAEGQVGVLFEEASRGRFPIPPFGDQRAYDGGFVVLPDAADPAQ